VNATLQANAIMLIAGVGGLTLLDARLTLLELGLRAQAIGSSVRFTFSLWVIINLFAIGYLLIRHKSISLHRLGRS
jgi:hypothetical protein